MLQNDLRDGVRSLGPQFSQMTYEDAMVYLSKRGEGRKWLVILDNADDSKMSIVDHIPQGEDGTVIITSRNRNLSSLAPNCHLHLRTNCRDQIGLFGDIKAAES